jgi:putative membrane-bound dehydrogenase-like protein
MKATRRVAMGLVMLAGALAASDLSGDTPGPKTPTEQGPVPPAQAAGRMTLPEGFHATLFAGEPDVHQPIAMAFDPRGRLWVAECYSYPDWSKEGHDRILIFEDANGDGRFDRRTVFWEKGANISGLTLGFGGIWVCATPDLLFIPDRDGDDIPDGEPQVKLDGWDLKAQHNVFNALTWGPDGWLYGCNGILSNSRVGKPGTPDAERVAMNCGVWRFHPTREVFEVVANGTTNPWGLDFDDHGEAFITNCVIPHLYRVIPGAHYERMFGQDFNPHLYGLIGSSADHIHWAGGRWQDSRGGQGKHSEAGGGHAHVGAMIYLGDNWPDRYRNSIFTCNVHGHRVNNDFLRRSGAGYVARHGQDFLLANDDWFRGLELKYGPDGSVFLTDWSDTGECHEFDADGAHRENGRIYKISYGKPRPVQVDLAKLADDELVRLQLHENDWFVRNARRMLQERAATKKDMSQVHRGLLSLFETNPDVTRKLRALWALHVTGGLDKGMLVRQLDHESEYVRNWAVRLLCDGDAPADDIPKRFAAMAESDTSPLVRLALASALQRLPKERRWGMAGGLVAHGEDSQDPELPLMIWYGIEPLVSSDGARAVALTDSCKIPLIRRNLARRSVMAAGRIPGSLVDRLNRSDDAAFQRDLLAGMLEALRGRKTVEAPDGWPAVSARLAKGADPEVREQCLLLSLMVGDPGAASALKETMMSPDAGGETRTRALQALVERRIPELAGSLQALIDQPAMRGTALRALAAYGDEETPRVILRSYGSLSEAEKEDAVNTLSSRLPYARALLEAVAKGTIPKRDLSVTTARQLLALGSPEIAATLERVWGSVRPTSKEKAALMAKYKELLTPDAMRAADPSRGRHVFNRACLQCHRLYEGGGDVGPDLTGSDRANVDYVLENVLDPSGSVGRDFQLTTVATTDGRLISGIVREQSEASLVIQTVNERIILPREDVEDSKPSSDSMMPEGLLDKLAPAEVRDLIAYLATKSQVPLPEEKPSAQE